MRNKVLSLLVIFAALLAVLISNYRQAGSSVHDLELPQPGKRPMPPARRGYVKGPRGKVGGIFLMNGELALTFQVWFAKGCSGHEQAVDTLFQAYREHPGKVGVLGMFGIKDSKDKVLAKSMKWIGRRDLIELSITDTESKTAGKTRRITFEGFEGKDYSIDEFRRAIGMALENK